MGKLQKFYWPHFLVVTLLKSHSQKNVSFPIVQDKAIREIRFPRNNYGFGE